MIPLAARRLLFAFLAALYLPAAALAASDGATPIFHLADPVEWRVSQHGPASLGTVVGMGDQAVLVVTGGALRSSVGPPGREVAFAVAMLDAARVAVVNLAHRDLAGDPKTLEQALEGGRAKFISASFHRTGQTWQPFAVVQHGGRRIAFIGVSGLSPSMDLPEGKVIPDLEYVSPIEAVREALEKISGADSIVVLADLPLAEALELRAEFAELAAVINSGRGGFQPVGAELRGVHLSPLAGLTIAVWEENKEARVIALDPPERPDPAYVEVLRRFDFQIMPLGIPPDGLLRPDSPSLALAPGHTEVLNLVRENRAVRWTIHSAVWLDDLGAAKAPEGLRWLVFDVEWENLLTPQLVQDAELPVAYSVRELGNHLYLVADAARIVPMDSIQGVPNLLEADKGLTLPGLGSTRRGLLAYALPAELEPGSLEFRYYDFAHGHFTAGIASSADVPEPVPGPGMQATNEIVTAGLYGIRTAREMNGRRSIKGMTFVELEFRARSMFTFEAPASAFVPLAGPDETIEVGTVCDWLEAHKYVHLVVDGEYAYTADPQLSTLAANPRFLPDLMTGGTLVFQTPEPAASLVLRADFPNARLPSGEVIRARPITLALEGDPGLPRDREAVWEVTDDTLRVAVTGLHTSDVFAGASSGPGKTFLVLDVTVRNHGARPEFFQTVEQLRHVDASGRQAPPHPSTYEGRHRPVKHVWVPDAEQRSFQLAYLIDEDQDRVRLAYRGFTLAESVELEPGREALTIALPAEDAPLVSRVDRLPVEAQPASIVIPEEGLAGAPDPSRSREQAWERLALRPLNISEADFNAPSVVSLSGPVHESLEEALLVEEPWTVRGKLERQQRHYFKLAIDGPPQLWHIGVTGVTLEYLDPGGRRQFHRSPASGSRTASVTGLLLLPGEHWFAVHSVPARDYTFRAVPLGPPDPHAEIEPNDDVTTAQLLELDVHLTGRLYDVGDRDFYRFSIAAEENLAFELQAPEDMTLRMELLEVYGGSTTRNFHGAGGGNIRHGTRLLPGDYLVSIFGRPSNQRSDHPYVLQVRRLDPFDPDPGLTTEAPGSTELRVATGLPLTMTLGGEAAAPAAFFSESQRMRLPLQILNHGPAALNLQLDAHAGLAEAVISFAETEFSVPPGQLVSTTLDVLLPPDLHTGRPLVITVRARDAHGAWTTAQQRLIPRCATRPLEPDLHRPLPETLLGGLNVAWTALGADVPADDRERNQVLKIFDGYTPVNDGYNRPPAFPREFTVRLAGDAPVPVAGVALFPQAGRADPNNWTKSFDVMLSLDGKDFQEVYNGELERQAREQAFVFDAPIPARYARLRINDNHGGTTGRMVLGQWKVIAQPGVHIPGMAQVNIASVDLGAHVVWEDPISASRSELLGMLGEGRGAGGFNLREARPVQWVIGFHQQRAARITELQWVDPPASWRFEPLSEVVVSVSMTSPLGPWTELGVWKLERNPEGIAHFVLPEPRWARYVLFTSYDPDKPRTSWQKPQTLRILEQLPDVRYRSILAEWGHYARNAVYEHLQQPDPEPYIPLHGLHSARAEAHPLSSGEAPYSGAVQVGVSEEWHQIDIPQEANRLTLTLTGRPNLRVLTRLEDAQGAPVAMQREDSSPRERILRAEVVPGARYFLRVYEPPRSIVFVWDHSGSMGPYKAALSQGLRRFVEEVTPGMEYANFLPFQSESPKLLHPEWSDQSHDLWVTLTNYHGRDDSSNAEPNLAAATKALADRDGARAVLLLTDAETFGFSHTSELWQAMAQTPPQIFSVELHTGRSQPYQQNLMQSWAQVNSGHYSLFKSQQDIDVAFSRASCLLRRPAQYTLSAMTDLEEAVEEEVVKEIGTQGVEMLDALVKKGRAIAHGILFDVNSHTIRSQSFPVLNEIGSMLQTNPDLRIIIEGHTDSTGRASWNQVLSERRAESVRKFLIDNHGIEPGRLESVGYGQERPADTNETAEGRQNNRRVELVRIAP